MHTSSTLRFTALASISLRSLADNCPKFKWPIVRRFLSGHPCGPGYENVHCWLRLPVKQSQT
jgi:hypothetical protein